MNDTSWIMILKSYWLNGLETAWTIYIPLIAMAVFIVLSLVINAVRTKTTPPEVLKSWSSVYLAGIVTSVIGVLSVLCLMLFSDFFASNFCQLGFLVGLVVIGLFTILSFVKICNLVKRKDENALGMEITEANQRKGYIKYKKVCFCLWLVSLLLAIPFITLAIPRQSKYLISIVLDNSISMEQHLPLCTQALEQALLPTRRDADYVFTTIDYTTRTNLFNQAADKVVSLMESDKIQSEREAWKKLASLYYDDIVRQKSSRTVSTNTVVYNDVQSMFNAFAQMGISENGSPVYEGIWQNYLLSRDLARSNSYTSKKMIVITDGEDVLYAIMENAKSGSLLLRKDIFKQTGELNQTADDFYDAICTINYGNYSDDLFFKDCAGSIDESYDGTDEKSYFDAFRSILPEMFFDQFLLYFLIGFSVLLSAILLIIKTIKL